jgi:hypothetical protein
VLPALLQALVDVALVELGVADESDHPALRPGRPAAGADVVLHQARERGDRDAEADRAGREIDVVGVLGPARIALRPAPAAERLELVAALGAEQVLDRVEHRSGVGLDRDTVLRP